MAQQRPAYADATKFLDDAIGSPAGQAVVLVGAPAMTREIARQLSEQGTSWFPRSASPDAALQLLNGAAIAGFTPADAARHIAVPGERDDKYSRGVLGVITLGLAWLLLGLVFPVVGLGYNALTIGGPNSATIGQRMMGLEVRMWFGGKVTPLIAAFHALLFWFSFVIFCPILLWCFFDQRKRCLHDILAGVVVINRL